MMRTQKVLMLAVVVSVGVVAAGAALAQSRADGASCPGKIICPLTGEKVCLDKCPAVDRQRPDCPGRIVCPLTGKLVCKDRCALEESVPDTEAPPAEMPPCCAKTG